MVEKSTKEQVEAVLQALNKALEVGPWKETTFLRVIGKNLQKIRDDLQNQLNPTTTVESKKSANLLDRVAARSGQKEIFISLYAAGGDTIQIWERLIANLPKQVISRPIYANEEDVREHIRFKANNMNEAYISIFIKNEDILDVPSEKIPKDRFGKPLLILKDKSIELENISRFVHAFGVYSYHKGRLTKKSLS